MTAPNKFTKAQEKAIYEVGRQIEQARLSLRLSTRTAAEKTVVPTRAGHLGEATWRRTELGYTQISINGQSINKTYRPKAMTLMAIAEVVGLDGAELCEKVGLTPPPTRIARLPATRATDEVTELKTLARELLERLEHLERGGG